MSKSLLKKFKRDIKKIANQSKLDRLYIQFGKNLAPSKLLKNIDKLHRSNFIWGNRGPNKFAYTRADKINILKSLTKGQKIFIGTAISKGGKDMGSFGFRGKKTREGKTHYASASIGIIKLQQKRKSAGIDMKLGLRFQKKATYTPRLTSIRSEFKMEPGPIAEKLRNETIAMYAKLLENRLLWIRDQEWFKALSHKEKKKYINDNVIDPLEKEFREAMGDNMSADIERTLRYTSYNIAKETIFYYKPEE